MAAPSSSPLLHTRLDIHDRKQFELKLEYQPTGEDSKTRYLVEAFFFLPASLNVDADTYPRQDFYADIHNYVRLKTPVLTLEEMLFAQHSPLVSFEKLVDDAPGQKPMQAKAHEARIVYEAKLVSCVFRGALRRFVNRAGELCEQALRTGDPGVEPLIESFSRDSVRAVVAIRARYREIANRFLGRESLEEKSRASLRLVDEYMSLSVEQFVRKAVADMERLPRTHSSIELRKELMAEVIAEESYRKDHKLRSVLSPTGDNEEYMHRMGFLKKFCMNILFLSARREHRRVGTAEEVLFAVAAGLAMAFATLVAFWGQQRFPQVSLNFFLILVVGYMMKDRIKEGLRRIFANFAAKHLFDRTTTITDPTTKKCVGICKEKVDHTMAEKVPAEVLQVRRKDDFVTVSHGELTETVIRYQKQIVLESEVVPKVSGRMTGVTDIIRFNIERLLRDMDDPEYALEYVDLEDLSVGRIRGAKSYQVDLAFRFSAEDGDQRKVTTQLVRLVLDRNGIKRMARSEPDSPPTTPILSAPVRPAA